MNEPRTDIRLALPSKGRLAEEALDLLASAGLRVHHPNPRQYMARIPSLPALTVVFQRPGDIVVSVRDGSVDFGITGWDVVSEHRGENGEVLPMLQDLGFGHCRLHVIVPESFEGASDMDSLRGLSASLDRPLRVATKYPHLTGEFLAGCGIRDFRLIEAEGTLEIAPIIGYADVIADLVSTGTTLRDNRLRTLEDGLILRSEAALIAHRAALESRPEVLSVARQLLEFITAHLRAQQNVLITANMRGDDPRAIASAMFERLHLGGLQGPTISPVFTRDGETWHAVNVVVGRESLAQAISELRAIGGSGVVVTPVKYIFEEEPEAYRRLLAALRLPAQGGTDD